MSRRGFLKDSAGAVAAGGVVLDVVRHGREATAQTEPGVLGPGPITIGLHVNGTTRQIRVEPRTTLAEASRDALALTGTKVVCDRGACGACTVWLDGAPVCACMLLALEIGDRAITTIEGLAAGERLHPATALVALGARLELGSAQGAVREVALDEFLVAPSEDVRRENRLRPGELLTAVRVPALPATAGSAHLKQGEKESFDWAIAETAAMIERDGAGRCVRASVVLGAAAPVPWRAREAEATLIGQPVTEAVTRQAARAALQDARPLSQNAYKLPLFEAIVARAILAAAGGR
jgi:xanthine dehydrogenase iron-sulfur cluster and FAD-binding subunit A